MSGEPFKKCPNIVKLEMNEIRIQKRDIIDVHHYFLKFNSCDK